MAVAALQSALSLLIALGILRTVQVLLLRRNANSALGQGLTYFIGTV